MYKIVIFEGRKNDYIFMFVYFKDSNHKFQVDIVYSISLFVQFFLLFHKVNYVSLENPTVL